MKVRPETMGGIARLLLTSFLLVILIFSLATVPGRAAQAATWTVIDGGDTGVGTLRNAIDNAADGDTILFAPGVTTVTLTSNSLFVVDSLNITGPVEIVRGDGAEFRIFNVDSSGTGITVNMNELTVSNGFSVDLVTGGGGLYVGYADTVNLNKCVFENNHTRDGVTSSFSEGADGGAIYNRGTLRLSECLIKYNGTGGGAQSAVGTMGASGGRGGGIYNEGKLEITDSTIAFNTTGDGESKNTDNDAAGHGGNGAGIFSANGSVLIHRSTIKSNVTGMGGTANGNYSMGGHGGSGGGIFFGYGIAPVAIINSTITGNYTGQGGDSVDLGGDGGNGGGIYTRMPGVDLQVSFSTITNNGVGDKGIGPNSTSDGHNGQGGGIYREDGTTTLWHTILANNGQLSDVTDGPDCHSNSGNIESDGYNLIGIESSGHSTTPCSIALTAADIVNQDPGLGLLELNDPGLTETHALKFGSPCIDAGQSGTVAAPYNTDQRGVDRPQNLRADIGAFESRQYTVAGLVEDEYAQALPDVVMQGLPSNPATDTAGEYSAALPEGWNGTVTPVKSGYTFIPQDRTYNHLDADAIADDYIAYFATTTHVISGFVKTAGNEGVSGVTMMGLPGDPVTVTDGSYSATVTTGWGGTVIPEKTGYTFDPASKTYSNVTADQTGQDYLATLQANETITGHIALADQTPVSGVALIGYPLFGQTFITDSNGDYEVTLPDQYNGRMSPYKAGYRFTPDHVAIDLTGGSVAAGPAALNQDFTASTVTPITGERTVPAGTLQKDYVMTVLGLHPRTPTAVGVFGIAPADYDKTQIRIGRWNPTTSAYDEYPLTGETDIRPGWTTWVLSRNVRTFEVQGYDPVSIPGPTGNGVYFPVKPGWNQVGNPFEHGVAMNNVRFVNQSTNTNVTFWIWNGTVGDYQTISANGILPARQGGWINAPTSGWIFFEETVATSTGRSTQNLVSAPADAQRPPDPPGQLNSNGSGGTTEGGGAGGCFLQTLVSGSN